MWVIKDEFYRANEYNATTEFMHFPAETYTFTKEFSNSGKEYADTGAEVTTLQKRNVSKTKTKSDENTLLNKLINSVKGVATTSAVVAVAAVGAIAISTPPKVDLLDLTVGGTYVEYQLSIEALQDDLEYFILISTSNESDQVFAVDTNGIYQNRIDGLKPTWEYSLSFVSYDEYLGKTTYFEEKFQTTTVLPDDDVSELPETPPEILPDEDPPAPPVLPNYDVGISTISVSGLNEIRIDFWHTALDDTCRLELRLDYADGETIDPLPIEETDLQRGYVTAPVAETATFVSVTPVITYGENEQMTFTAYEHTFDRTLDADIKVDGYNGNIVFYLKGITNGATYVNVVDTQTQETLAQEQLYLGEEWYTGYVKVYYTTNDTTVCQYTVFLTDSEGQKTTDDFTAEIDTEMQRPNYTFNYKNPGEVGITYNDDGTINVYIQTDFACEDERLYYQVTLGKTSYQSREPLFAAEGLANQTYPLVYEICYDENGMQYVISNISVSGTVNEFYFNSHLSATVSEQSVTVAIDYLVEVFDLNSIRLISSTGEEFQLTENDFVYQEEYGIYTYMQEFASAFEYVTIYATCSPFADNMADIESYKGSLSTQFQTIIYNE